MLATAIAFGSSSILTCSRWFSAAIPSAIECQMNRTLKGCKRRASPFTCLKDQRYLEFAGTLIRVRKVLNLVSGGIAALKHWLKAGIPSACGINTRNHKSQVFFCIPPSHPFFSLKEFVGKCEVE